MTVIPIDTATNTVGKPVNDGGLGTPVIEITP
jgi:hypothetical protein